MGAASLQLTLTENQWWFEPDYWRPLKKYVKEPTSRLYFNTHRIMHYSYSYKWIALNPHFIFWILTSICLTQIYIRLHWFLKLNPLCLNVWQGLIMNASKWENISIKGQPKPHVHEFIFKKRKQVWQSDLSVTVHFIHIGLYTCFAFRSSANS